MKSNTQNNPAKPGHYRLASVCIHVPRVCPTEAIFLDSPQVTHITVNEEFDGQRLDNFLFRTLKGVPKTHIYRIIRSGEVRVNKGRASAE